MRIKNLAIAATVVGSLALAACTGGGTTGGDNKTASGGDDKGTVKEITFQTWSLKNDKFTPYFENLIAEYEKQHPDVKIKWMDQPGDGYEEKVNQQANSNQLPDVINIPEGFAKTLSEVDKIVNLKEAAPDSLNAYLDGALGAYTFDGKDGVWGYPWYLGTDLNWYNTEQLKKAGLDPEKLPTNYDEYFQQALTAAKNTNGEVRLISSMPNVDVFSNAGIEVFKDGKFVFNNDQAVALLEKYIEAYKANAVVPEALNGDYTGNAIMYKQGKVAYTTAGGGFAKELATEAPDLAKVTISQARFGVPPLFMQGISVAKNSKYPEVALDFAQFVTNNQNQVEFLKLAQGFFPGTKEANANPESFLSVIELPAQKTAAEQAAKAMDRAKSGPINYTDEMKQFTAQQVALAMKGDISAKDALDKAVKHANDGLDN
ncbi:ABC transporter substrate-binding protein [Boudabousia liubingyangii]|uniref:ABC transporter substrate-binding protein n=1 Tax=Boudabousia liubingyangii TaxID=1921764 RepID=A0A1Q5PQM0_9ACTO|nr:extracellular solute-binding protein [Boudabousia liubingyangii]OKL49769.1 ABC transporter substrate-binding protein [Boudabousia liubingyangii]